MSTKKSSLTLLLIYVISAVFFVGSFVEGREYTSEEKLSQMFILGFNADNIDSFYEQTSEQPWGGYIFYNVKPSNNVPDPKKFKTNYRSNIISYEQARKFLMMIRGPLSNTRIKPFFAFDFEGGDKQLFLSAIPSLNSPSEIALVKDEGTTRAWAAKIAEALKELGFNFNLAPVVDVARESNSSFSKKRKFSANYQDVITQSRWFCDEQKKKNIICTAKHFPGIEENYSEVKRNRRVGNYSAEENLAIYRELINNNIPAVMVSCFTFPMLDPDVPACLSPKIINKLRNELNYQGLIITDDLSFFDTAKLSDQELSDFIVNLINSGDDLLLFANTEPYDSNLAERLKKIRNNILAKGFISDRRIEQSFEKILAVKMEYGIEPKEIYLNYKP